MKKGVIHIFITTLFLFSIFVVGPKTLKAEEKSILQTLSGEQKTCRYVKDGLYKPFSNISTDFVLFKDVFNLKTKGGKTECLVIAGSTDRFLFMIFRLFIGFSSVLAVVYIAIAGIGLIVEEADPNKRIKARQMLKNALIGLLLSVGAWVILYTVNNKLTEFSLDETIGKTGFDKVIEQGAKNAARNIAIANSEIKQGNANGVGGTGSLLTTAGAIDQRADSIEFARTGTLVESRDPTVPNYIEKSYTPTTIDGKTFYVGKVTTFGGVGDINTKSYDNLAIDDSMREIDLNQNDEFISARWAYSMVGKNDLKSYDVEVANPTTGKSIILRANNGIAVKDWGPHPNANSNADYDTSKAVLDKIGVPDGGQIAVRLIPKK